MATQVNELLGNGWHPVPVDPSRIFGDKPYNNEPAALSIGQLTFPDQDPIVKKVYEYTKERLPTQTFNHSMRVYHYAMAILYQQFPEHADQLSCSTLALTSLLHDLGTTSSNMSATRMSFEFYGAILARDLLLSKDISASQDTADAVFEAITRHQDLGTEGKITLLGQIIQLATIYDNVGGQHPTVPHFDKILHVKTRKTVIERYPRPGWLGCFAATERGDQEETLVSYNAYSRFC